jgi:Protein of unknown function (DUF1592)/Protein of unknown function (DUF1588)/Protein of unknown function (DUF1595)/Protein of unknown function (DUF1585)
MMRKTWGWSAAILAGVLGAGCIGSIGDGDDVPDAPPLEPGDFACTPGDPSVTVLQRLSRTQHLGSVHAFAAALLGAADAGAVLSALESTITLVPVDSSFDHDRLDQAVGQSHVDGQYHLALALAEQLLASPERQQAVLGDCAMDGDASNDDACLEDFVRRIGYLAHRRPLTDDEVAFYVDEVYPPADGMDLDAFGDVIAAMLLSPNFLYRFEIEGAPVQGRADLFELSAHELASRLSFHFWDGPPDDALYAAADSGELLTEAGYAAQIDRMLGDPRTIATFDRYYSEWLMIDDLAPLHQQLGQPAYDAFVGSDLPTPEMRDHMLEDTLDLARYVSWQGEGDFASLFTADFNFAKTPDMASIYGGVEMWQEGSEPARLPAGQRAGILTRPAMLATGSTGTHPVLRGRDIRRRVMCDELPPPPANAADDTPELDPIMTERERMEAITEQPGSSCIGCHHFINPVGYTLEGYDGLGRIRTEELLYNEDGSVLATLPVDTSVDSLNLEPGDATGVVDGIELSERIGQSNGARACFARHYFRFAFARMEDEAIDGCELESIRAALEEGQSLREVFRNIAMTPTFRLRKLAD